MAHWLTSVQVHGCRGPFGLLPWLTAHGEADGYVDHMTNGVSLPENEVKLNVGIELRK